MKNIGFMWLAALVMILVFVGSLLLFEPYKLKGSEITSPTAAPSFSLLSSKGEQYKLKDHQGKIVILFFGYTYCPDICPTTLYKFKEVENLLGKKSNEMEVVLITVDPERDTQEKLSSYLKTFDDTFFGLTGNENDLETIWKDYGVFRQISNVKGGKEYLVDHSTRLYLIDKKGNLRATYLVDTPISDLVSDIKYLLKSAE